jgi:hypothetical protein
MPRACLVAVVLAAVLAPTWAAGQASNRVSLGIHGGFNFSDGAVEDERIGIQGSVPVIWRLSLNPAFGYFYNFPGDPSGFLEGSAWEAYLTARVHPFGTNSWLGLGYGLTFAHASVEAADGAFSDSDSDATDVGVVSVTLPKGRVRPFAEVYFIDLLERSSAVGGHLLFGLNYYLP